MLIAFDLDDTLIDTSGCVTPYKLKECLRLVEQQKLLTVPFEEAYLDLMRCSERAESSRDAIRSALERYRAMHLWPRALEIYTAPLPAQFRIAETPGAKQVVETLSRRPGVRLALVTGGKPLFQLEKLEKAGFEPSLFSKIAVPEDSKKKPHFEVLLKEFSEHPRDCIAVGDRIQMDLAPAYELGFRTVHMRWGRGLMWNKVEWVDHTINTLPELLEWL